MRTLLTSDLVLNVNSSTGSDTAGKTAWLAGSSFLTLQAARDFAMEELDLGGKYGVTYAASGNFTGGFTALGKLQGQRWDADEEILFSAGSSVTAPTDGVAFDGQSGAAFRIRQPGNSLSIYAPGSNGVGVNATDGAKVNIIDMVTFYCGRFDMQVCWYANLIANSYYSVGGREASVFVSGGCFQNNPGSNVYFLGSPNNYSKGTIWVQDGMCGLAGVNYSGAPTGKRFVADANGTIVTSGGANKLTFIPGTVAGECLNGGVII